jgi:predicted ArsR family transcriptional regulator
MQVGLHHNTVRSHLELLVQAGLATRRAEERSVPGRPRVVFEAMKDEAALEPSRYELLAKILTSYLAGSAKDPSAAATELGQAWGSYLTERPAPFDRISREEAVGRLLDQFAGLGFQPEMASDQEGDRMLLHRCPFREIAQARPDVVCSIHLGLMRGALAELGAPVAAIKLLPFVEPSLCVAYLEPTA